MKHYARESNGKAVEIIRVRAGEDIADLYPPSLVATLVEVSASVKEGWVREAGGFVAPIPLAPSVEQLLAYARAKRYAREIAGTSLGELPLRTDRETRSALTEAAAAVTADPQWSTRWELPNGARVTVDAVLLQQIIMAVANWRAGAFAIFDEVANQIDLGEIGSFAEIDVAFA